MAAEKTALSPREKHFCYYMARLQNPEEAAAHAGLAASLVPDLLEKAAVRRRVETWRKRLFGKGVELSALAGLFRIAFGSPEGAVSLAWADEEGMGMPRPPIDLFSLEEVKRSKGGGVEVKLCDRAKALDLLLRWGRERGSAEGKSLLSVLERSVSAVESSREGRGGGSPGRAYED